jgi:sugar phosphate isomerase/epimerase
MIARDNFFGAIEFVRIGSPELKASVIKILDTADIRKIIAGQPPLLAGKLDINSENETERKKAVADVKISIDDAAWFGAEKTVILSGPMPAEGKKETARKALIASLNELAAYAEEKGTVLSLETFDETVDKKCFAGNSKFSAGIAEEIRKKHPGFGLALDLSHLPLLKESPAAAIEAAKKVLNHVHIGNCYIKERSLAVYGDNHPRYSFPGAENSVEDLAEFLRQLFKAGYLKGTPSAEPPIVSFEVKPQQDEEPELVIADAKRVWCKAWALL